MLRLFSVTLLLLLVVTLSSANKRTKSPKGGKHERTLSTSECSAAETQYGSCVPHQGDCGEGLRDAVCKGHNNKINCRIPCNWRKEISDCKYKFGAWGSCDPSTNTRSRSGTLKKALFNAECQATVKVSKPCSPKTKKTRGEKSK